MKRTVYLWVIKSQKSGFEKVLKSFDEAVKNGSEDQKRAVVRSLIDHIELDGEDVTSAASFDASCQKGTIKAQSKYAGRKFGISMDVTPGKESYLYKSQKRRSALVKVATVRKFGPAKIQEILIGSAKYVLDEDNGKLTPAIPNQKPFTLTNGMMVKYSGVINDAGVDKDFEVTSKLNFKKKK